MSFRDRKLFVVDEVEIFSSVSETDSLVWRDLNKKIEVDLGNLKGLPIWKISLNEVKQRLARYPEIYDIEIQKSWPNSIEISYRLPALSGIVRNGANNEFDILTSKGNLYGPVKWSQLPDLPWVKGEWVRSKDNIRRNLLNLLDVLPKEGPLTIHQISEIEFNDLDGFLLTLIKTGQQIRFGTDNFEIKSLRVAQVLEYLQTRGLESRVIDANFSKKVLVRPRNHP